MHTPAAGKTAPAGAFAPKRKMFTRWEKMSTGPPGQNTLQGEFGIVGDFPVAWTGKKMPIAQAYNRFIFGRKYQLSHTSGLTYDFLYAMAKELHDSQSLMLMAAGAKGNEPLIFQENGKPYRAFLEGRIDGDKYLLLMHLSNLELKSIL